MEDSVMELLEELEEILDDAKAIPFSRKVGVDREVLFEVLTEVRLKLPNEIKQAKWVIEERNKILLDTQKEAEEIIKEAHVQAEKLVEAHEITKLANEQAEEIVESAKKTSREMRLGAMEYADEQLSKLEERIRETIESIHENNTMTQEFFMNTMEIVYKNRQELRGDR